MATASATPPDNPWPRRLKRLRSRLKLTQAKAAARVGLSLLMWAYFEHGRREPTGATAILLGQFCRFPGNF